MNKPNFLKISLVKGRLRGIWLLFLFIFLFGFVPSVQAVEQPPILIDNSQFAYPPSLNNNQNYTSNNIFRDSTDTISKTFSVSQSFPSTCNVGTSGQEVCNTITVDHIQQPEDMSKNFTNWGLRSTIDTNLNTPADVPADRLSAFHNYDITKDAFNATVRGLSYPDKMRQISRKIDEVVKFINHQSSTCMDEVIEKGGTKTRFGRAVLAYSAVAPEYFYYPDNKADTEAIPLPDYIKSALNKSIAPSPGNPVEFFNDFIQPGCSNSIAMAVEPCDLNDNGASPDCSKGKQPVSIPGGAALTSADYTAMYLPANAQVQHQDFSQTEVKSGMLDKPNALTWTAIFHYISNIFSGVLHDSRTFSGTTQVNYYLPTTFTNGSNINFTKDLYLMPASTANSIKNAKTSSTDDGQMSLHLGNSNQQSTQVLHTLLTPCNWQADCAANF